MKEIRIITFIGLCLLLSVMSYSQENDDNLRKIAIGQINDSILQPSLKLDLTLFDLPYQFDAGKTVNNGNLTFGSFFKGYANPSMSQSLSLTTDLYSAMHFGIDRIFKVKDKYRGKRFMFWRKLLNLGLIGVADFFTLSAPGFGGWEHEEFHRAVMSRFHVNSFDDMNTWPIWQNLVYVNSVTDEDLIRFKKESPYDFIRLPAAGIEGGYQMIDKLQRENFFYDQYLSHEVFYNILTINSVLYVESSASPGMDEIVDKINNSEKEILDRDFTGFDFSAWVYDLFKPTQPYEDRGVHPSGNGIDRYIKTTDLTSEELSYLKKQGKLQWLNMISPMMFGLNSIKINNDLKFNFAIRNYLTSFGNEISLNVFLKIKEINGIFRYHHAKNYHSDFPAIEAELFEQPFTFMENDFLLSPRIIIGVQPKNQSFFTEKLEFLGYAGCRIDWIQKQINPWVEMSVKTDGWIAGNEFLSSNISLRMGLSARFK